MATESSRTTRPKAPGTTSTPPASPTRACTSAPARNATRGSPERRWKTTRSATRARTRVASWLIESSIFRHNVVGIAPNSENPGDGPPPQDGECGRPNIENPNPTPIITTTNIPRCTIIRNNVITENNNLTVPVNGSTGVAPWGAGVELPGDYADLVEQNVIANNPTNGVLAFEYPNPFTPENGFEGTLFFQLAGNRISNNVFSHNGSQRWRVHRRRDDRERFQRNLRVSGIALREQLRQRQPVHGRDLPGENRRNLGLSEQNHPEPGRRRARSRISRRAAAGSRRRSEKRCRRSDSRHRRRSRPCPTPCSGVPKNPLCS